MNDIIIVKDLTFKYKDKIIFDKLNINIKKNKITSIVGPNGSGKSTLVKIFLGLLETDAYVNINNIILCHNNLSNIRKNIGVVFENPDNQFVAETVMDDMAFTLENMQKNKTDIRKKVKQTALFLGITDLLEKNPHNLSGGEKQMVALASAVIHNPNILILDEALTMIEPLKRDKIYRLLKILNKDNHMTIINITHDLDETLFSDEIIVMNKGKIILNGPKEEVYSHEKEFNNIGLDLPFMVDLSNKLKFYDLIDDLVFDMEELVNKLWK